MNVQPDIIVEVKAFHGKESRMRRLAMLAPGPAEREWANEQAVPVPVSWTSRRPNHAAFRVSS